MAENPDQKNDHVDKYLLKSDVIRNTQEVEAAMKQVPLTLQPFFKDQIDLNQELVKRFPNMPLMSVIRMRNHGNGERGIATLSSQDGSASLIVDISSKSNAIQFSFTLGSMLSLRFHLTELSDLDRRAWLDNMENRVNDIVFLWGQSRWEKDYVICVPHSYYISLLAFSPNNFEAAVRITPAASDELFQWMHSFWYPDVPPEKDDSQDSPPDAAGKSILNEW